MGMFSWNDNLSGKWKIELQFQRKYEKINYESWNLNILAPDVLFYRIGANVVDKFIITEESTR